MGKNWFERRVDNVVNAGKTIYRKADEGRKDLTKKASNTVGNVRTALRPSNVLTQGSRFIGNAYQAGSKFAGGVVREGTRMAGDAYQAGSRWVGRGIQDGSRALGNAVGGPAGTFIRGAGGLVGNATTARGEVVGALIRGAGGLVGNAITARGEVVGAVIRGVGGFAGGVARGVENFGADCLGEVMGKPIQPAQQKWTSETWGEKMALIDEGLRSGNPQTIESAKTYRQHLVAGQMAMLSEQIYADHPTPAGWRDISNDAEALKAYGLKPEDMRIEGTPFRAQMLEPDPALFGDTMKPTLVFKGTTIPGDIVRGDASASDAQSDWLGNNMPQSMGFNSEYYARAVDIGNRLEASGRANDVNITGHSLGGGLASAASVASGADAYTFNSAGLHPDTLKNCGGEGQKEHNSNIVAYHVDGEVLTSAQKLPGIPEAKSTTDVLLPAMLDRTFKGSLPGFIAGSLSGGPFGAISGAIATSSTANHYMSAVNDGLKVVEAAAEEDLLRRLPAHA